MNYEELGCLHHRLLSVLGSMIVGSIGGAGRLGFDILIPGGKCRVIRELGGVMMLKTVNGDGFRVRPLEGSWETVADELILLAVKDLGESLEDEFFGRTYEAQGW